jgi:positive regulator of sigma E activity
MYRPEYVLHMAATIVADGVFAGELWYIHLSHVHCLIEYLSTEKLKRKLKEREKEIEEKKKRDTKVIV